MKITVNGAVYEPSEDIRLLDYLRDRLRICSVKDGCSEGACGACTVLVDGKALKACVQKLSKFDGKSILTVEGLTDFEKEAYAAAFSAAGAVQCGFCIPGMVLCAKALIDINPAPSPLEVRKAIRGNICRCTGYKKIEEAIMLAAGMLRSKSIPQPSGESGAIGELFGRIDAREKVLGTGLYTDDLVLPGMAYASAIRSIYPRALVKHIDTSKALAHPDAVAVLLAKDVPFNKTGHIIPDWDVLIAEGSETRYVGDAVALVVSRRKETLDEIKALVEIDYEPLKPVCSPVEALAPDAPLLHENGNVLFKQELKRVDVDAAFESAAHIITRHYSTPMTDHAFMEPECAIAEPDGNGGVMLYTGSQSVYDEQREIARMLKLPNEKVRSRSMLVGGGFGGKEDMSVQHHAALAAWALGMPVKVKLTRQESLNVHVKRHAMEIDMTTACDAEGRLLAMRATLISDCGAYASLGGPVLQRACTHAAGPYNYQNVEITGICVYTNNVPGGAFRGFGVTQSCFAGETNLNLLAREAGISPWNIRYINAIRPGQELPNGQIAGDDTALEECLLAVKDAYDREKYAGLAVCMKNSGVGVGLPDVGRCKLLVQGGKVQILTSAACMGQGIATVATQIVATVTGLSPALLECARPDTAVTPNSGTTTASRQTLFTGEAARDAALKLKEAFAYSSLGDLDGQSFEGEYHFDTDKMGSDKPNPVSHAAYSYAAHVVVMDESKHVTKVIAAHDVGRVINPKACEGQVEGGIVMGLGYALSEKFEMEGGYVKSRYGKLGLLRATDVPTMDITLLGKGTDDNPAFGAKGIGEISTIPTAPAADYAAMLVDGKERLSLPISNTPYRK